MTGGALILAGVYVGALLHIDRSEARAPKPRPEPVGVPVDCLRGP